MHVEISSDMISLHDNGLVFACLLDGKGCARTLDWIDVAQWTPADGPLWVHLERSAEGTANWLANEADLSDLTLRILLEVETRPRVFSSDDGLIAILRGVNLNAGANPDDMVAIRMCVSENRLITVRNRPLMTPRDMLSELVDKRKGARSAPELFVKLTERLTERMNSAVVDLDEKLDTIEIQLDDGDLTLIRRQLTEVRQTAAGLRRYIGPQREALARIQIERPVWLDTNLNLLLRESADKLQRYVEELDAARERAMVVRDEISNQLAEGMNRRMYALALVAGIFLPLGFLTGLLGINVGGMPGVDNSWAFWVTCLMLGGVFLGELYLFRRLKWF